MTPAGETDTELDPTTVRERLGLAEDTAAWLASLPAVGATEEAPALPRRADASALLARLAVPAGQIDEAVTAWRAVEADPALRWLLVHCAQQLITAMGRSRSPAPWPALPSSLGLAGRYLYVLAFLATLPAVRRYHQRHGIADDVSWSTLADLGRHMAIHQRMTGEGGLSTPNWLTLHFRGVIYELGRLQFHRSRINYDAETIERLGLSLVA